MGLVLRRQATSNRRLLPHIKLVTVTNTEVLQRTGPSIEGSLFSLLDGGMLSTCKESSGFRLVERGLSPDTGNMPTNIKTISIRYNAIDTRK